MIELATEGSIHLCPLLQEVLKGALAAATLTDPIVEIAAQFSALPGRFVHSRHGSRL